MRQLSLFAGLILLASSSGCGSTRFDWLKPGGGGGGSPQPVPTVDRLVAYLNDNAGRIKSLRYEDISLTVTLPKHQSFGALAQMVVEKPLNFRMKARIGGGDVADVGSNSQEFWWWNSKDPNPAQYYCAYKDLREGRVRDVNFPIQPEWVIETLGLGPYGPASKYKLEHDAETVKLIEKIVSPSGKAVRKVIVFQRRPKRPPDAMVSDYLLLDDASGKEICSAHISEVHQEKAPSDNGGIALVILPRKIELNFPDMKIKLAMQMDRLTVNPANLPNAFVRQPLNGVASINIANGRSDVQQASGKK